MSCARSARGAAPARILGVCALLIAVGAPAAAQTLAAARARGNPVVDGLGMLLHQGRPGFEAWFGIAPEVTPELRAVVLS